MLPIISVVGIPGGGKTTLGCRLAREFGLYRIDLRHVLTSVTAPSPTVRQYIEGEPVPRELFRSLAEWMDTPVDEVFSKCRFKEPGVPVGILLPVLRNKLEQISRENKYKGILLENFPRSLSHARFAAKFFAFFGFTFPTLTIMVACPSHVVRSRWFKVATEKHNLSGFEKAIDLHWKKMPALRQALPESRLVRTFNDDSMTMEQTYLTLLTNLRLNQIWNDIVNGQSGQTLTSHVAEPSSKSDTQSCGGK
ncbi:hypothetical protein F5Y05DRAFT_339810 [Hypoxylon sp. FL0543]|nr:hypothetical protein F5Y05DRAFT_339810 [Hypoxylon sp. FL0543]